MPEGPETRVVADDLNFYRSKQILSVTHKLKMLVIPGKDLPLTINRVYAQSKRIVIELITVGNEMRYLFIFLQMNGIFLFKEGNHTKALFEIGRAIKLPQTNLLIHEHILYYNDVGSKGGGSLEYITQQELISKFSKLGKDVYEFNEQQLYQYLSSTIKKNQLNWIIAQALLDTKLFSGVGNYMRSDILYLAEIHPLVKLSHITQQRWILICRATLWVYKQSYSQGGMSYRDYLRIDGSKGKYKPLVYKRSVCPRGFPVVEMRLQGNKVVDKGGRVVCLVPNVQKNVN